MFNKLSRFVTISLASLVFFVSLSGTLPGFAQTDTSMQVTQNSLVTNPWHIYCAELKEGKLKITGRTEVQVDSPKALEELNLDTCPNNKWVAVHTTTFASVTNLGTTFSALEVISSLTAFMQAEQYRTRDPNQLPQPRPEAAELIQIIPQKLP